MELIMGRPKSGYSLLERLLNKVIVNEVTDCWEWQGATNNIGYGMIRDEQRMRTTHRVSYEEHNQAKIPSHLIVMHKCDNTICVNPAHLNLGTRSDNTQDMLNKGRAKPFGQHINNGGGMRGKKMPKTYCIHCNGSISNPAYARYHGDKCSSKL
jgi:hypothetical protein